MKTCLSFPYSNINKTQKTTKKSKTMAKKMTYSDLIEKLEKIVAFPLRKNAKHEENY